MRDLLKSTGAAELAHWLAFMDLEDEREQNLMAAAIGVALGGGEG